jgi:hypothetical protein
MALFSSVSCARVRCEAGNPADALLRNIEQMRKENGGDFLRPINEQH